MPTNPERAGFAMQALRPYCKVSSSEEELRADPEMVVVDLLSDLMHWCGERGFQFQHLVDRASRHYSTERDIKCPRCKAAGAEEDWQRPTGHTNPNMVTCYSCRQNFDMVKLHEKRRKPK